MAEVSISQIGDVRNVLGEGPVWDVQEQALYWTDVEGRRLWRYEPGPDRFDSWQTPERVGSFALRSAGNAILAMEHGLAYFDFESGKHDPIAEVDEADLGTRFNDGKVDRQGRFVAGTMDESMREPLGSLYRLEPDGSISRLDTGIMCSNGPCFSPDGCTLYFTDTLRYTIFAYDYDPDSGVVSNKRVFADIRGLGLQGAPDGCTVDSEGFLWGALCMGGTIARYAPDGSLDGTVTMPVSYISSVMLGGPNLDVLYATSISAPLLGRPAEEPNAGSLFAVEGLGVTGIPEPRFTG